jgi:hypothetical protein
MIKLRKDELRLAYELIFVFNKTINNRVQHQLNLLKHLSDLTFTKVYINLDILLHFYK